ncbi:MAG: ABC transporter permease [Thermomicrobiales bacterium]|jgi:peptide/nickel transport system permease protein|nr:ABC transporter permease [Thermomicrobiales bacterium]
MGSYIVRRVLQIIPLLIGISILVFILVNAVPGSPVSDMAFNPSVRPEDIARIKHALGLDQPLYKRYFVWISHVARGDLGLNMVTYQPVSKDIAARLPNTLKLTIAAFFIALVFSIPVGVYSAVRRNSWFDNIGTVLSVAGVSIPNFWFGLLLILFFSVRLGWFPSGGTASFGNGSVLDQLHHLILPAFSLAIVELAGWTRYIRGQMLEVIRQDYIRTAHAKGLRERTVIFRHAFRNAFLPLVTLFGLSIPSFFSGALIVETIFSWPGIGRLAYDATVARNYTVIMGTVMMSSALVVVGNLLADIGYSLLDPRIKQG